MTSSNSATSPLLTSFQACPLCASTETGWLRSDPCDKHPLWQVGLPETMHWMVCKQCGHVFSRDYFTLEGLDLLFSRANPGQLGGPEIDLERFHWAPTVERVQRHLPLAPWLTDGTVWMDIGCGSGGLVITAAEYGFTALGLDTRCQAVERITGMGYLASLGDLSELSVSDPVDVISLADVLEHVPFPREALARVRSALRPEGLLLVSCPNLDCGSWRRSTVDGTNLYWGEIEHLHNFSRTSLMRLLAEEGFVSLEYSVSTRYRSCMEVIARRPRDTGL
jgi:SAM-dependent methyltransferase